MRYLVPLVFLGTAFGLHMGNRPGALWVLPYTETLARRLFNRGAMGPTTLEEQLRASELTVWFLAAIGLGLMILSVIQTLQERRERTQRR